MNDKITDQIAAESAKPFIESLRRCGLSGTENEWRTVEDSAIAIIKAAIEKGIRAFLNEKASACLPPPDESLRVAHRVENNAAHASEQECLNCGKPVGNPVFTYCDNCWSKPDSDPVSEQCPECGTTGGRHKGLCGGGKPATASEQKSKTMSYEEPKLSITFTRTPEEQAEIESGVHAPATASERRNTLRESLLDKGIDCDKVAHSTEPNEPPTEGKPATSQEWTHEIVTQILRDGDPLVSPSVRIARAHNATLQPSEQGADQRLEELKTLSDNLVTACYPFSNLASEVVTNRKLLGTFDEEDLLNLRIAVNKLGQFDAAMRKET